MEQIKKIAEYLAPPNERERVIAMGGTAIKPQAQIMLEKGISQGMDIIIEVVQRLLNGEDVDSLTKDYGENTVQKALSIKQIFHHADGAD